MHRRIRPNNSRTYNDWLHHYKHDHYDHIAEHNNAYNDFLHDDNDDDNDDNRRRFRYNNIRVQHNIIYDINDWIECGYNNDAIHDDGIYKHDFGTDDFKRNNNFWNK